MPLTKTRFTLRLDNLQDAIDVDDNAGRSVPVNMNFVDEGYLTKDTGFELFGAVDASLRHSLFHYKKKSGTSYILSATGTKLQVWNNTTLVWDDLSPTFTAGAEFGFYVYDDFLWGCNGVEDYFKWDGTTFTTYASAPKGNVLEIFEDRMFVTGVTAEPLSYYYSAVADPSTFPVEGVVKPLGTDHAKTMKNYYGTLLLFKAASIWKLTFEYDQVLGAFIPKIANQSDDYGACSRKAVAAVENDLWFFTGREVRAIGFQDNQIGVFGINRSVISEPIKETLQLIPFAYFDKCAAFYENRRFYLSVPLTSATADTTFVCHTLYANSWTKYTGRDKAKINDFMVIDDVIYTTVASGNFGCIKWTDALNDISTPISSSVLFRRLEDEEFDRFRIYRYLDLLFKDVQGVVTGVIRTEANDGVATKEKAFFVGNAVEDELSTLGEVGWGESVWAEAFGDETAVSPFVKRRVSFLAKPQALLIGLSNARLNETFSIWKYQLSGYEQPKRMFSGKKIISIR